MSPRSIGMFGTPEDSESELPADEQTTRLPAVPPSLPAVPPGLPAVPPSLPRRRGGGGAADRTGRAGRSAGRPADPAVPAAAAAIAASRAARRATSAATGTAADGTAISGTALSGTAAGGTAANGTAARRPAGTSPRGTATRRPAGTAPGGSARRATATTATAAAAGTAAAGMEWRELIPAFRRSLGPGAKPRQRWTAVAFIVAPVVLTAVACASYDPGPTTARVTRSSVSTTVSGTGALRAITEQNMGFDKSGKLAELDVAVGDHVTAGQIVARIDDFSAQAALRKATAQLASEEARLDRIRDSDRVGASSDDAKSAQDIKDATNDQVDQTDRANLDVIKQAERQLDEARDDLRQAQTAYEADDARCSHSIGGDSRRKPGEVHQPNGLSGALYVPAPVDSSACDRSRKSGAVVEQARRRVSDAQAEVRQAQRRRVVEHSRQLVDIESARREERAAQHEAKDAKKTRPDDIAEQQAAVADAQTEVDVANHDVGNTVMRAPVAGTVSAINGTVGEYISGGSDTTPLAPGGRVGLPDVTSGAGGKDDSGSHAERPGGGSFMVLDDVNTFQVVVPLEEADAAKVSTGQAVDVTFDSLPGLTTKATVTAMSPTGTSIKDVTNYYATMVLDQLDPRLKDGLTAQANIIVGQVGNVLVVPNSAVQQGGDSGLVTVVDPSGVKRQVQVQLGMVGDGVTQVISGLREGQDVATGDS